MMINISARFVSHASVSEGDATAFADVVFRVQTVGVIVVVSEIIKGKEQRTME